MKAASDMAKLAIISYATLPPSDGGILCDKSDAIGILGFKWSSSLFLIYFATF